MKIVRFFKIKSPRRGSSLLAVLGAIAIITMLLIALLGLVRTEHRSTHAFGDSTEIRSLAEWPTNLVIGQLRGATDSRNGKRTWASQPGMIRTYKTNASSSTGRAEVDAVYKLYSSNAMVELSEFNPDNEVPPGDWEQQSAHFVDLNEPVVVKRDDGLKRDFPIIHANAATAGHDGFNVEKFDGAKEDHPIPMPVRWLYVLEDGSLALPGGGGEGTIAKFSGENRPTKDNPIVGRIAFWTDDETSKVNINTASEGRYWDVPRANTHFDGYNYADKQPVRNEYQRYPGHPATTSLSAVLEPYLETEPGKKVDPKVYFDLAPFVEHGGSKHGTVNVNGNTPPVTLDSDRLYASVDEFFFHAEGTENQENRRINHPGITRQMLEETRFLLTAHSRSPEVNLLDRPRISLWPIQNDEGDRNVVDRLFAFCSETTQADHRRLPYYFQRLSTHDLTDIGDGYGSSQSTVDDFEEIERNQELYKYLQFLTDQEVPGFGKSFGTKYPLDRDQILTEMVDYCRSGLNTMSLGLETPNNEKGYFYTPPRQVEGINSIAGEGQILPLKIDDTMGFGRNVTISEAAIVFYATKRDEEKTIRVDYPGRRHQFASGYRAKEMKAFLVLEFFTPSPGLPSWSQHVSITIEGMEEWTVDDKNLNFPMDAALTTHAINGPLGGRNGAGHACAHMNICQPFYYNQEKNPGSKTIVLKHRDMNSPDPMTGYAWHSATPVQLTVPAGENTTPAQGDDDDTLEFSGGPLKIVLRDPTGAEVIQEINMVFPKTQIPVPYAWTEQAEKLPAPHRIETSLNARIRHRRPNDMAHHLIRPGDVVRSMEVTADLKGAGGERLPGGDLRLYAATPEIPAAWFKAGGEIDENGDSFQYFDPKRRFAQGLRNGNSWQYWGNFATENRREHHNDVIHSNSGQPRNPYVRQSAYRTAGSIFEGSTGYSFNSGTDRNKTKLYRDAHPVCARGQIASYRRDEKQGDWDQGIGSNEDGSFINKPDETNSSKLYRDWGPAQRGGYFQRGYFDVDPNGVNFSPNRQIASAVMFGSLPTGVKSIRPWETLLFCPNPAGRDTGADVAPDESDHFGFSLPRDHLMLDLFWMPVTEPYAISEPFSTAGKVNMNYEIMPFRYIKRQTGIKAVLDSIEIMAIEEKALSRTKLGSIKGGRDQAHRQEVRYAVSTDPENGTLRGFENRFAEGDIFRSASEMCEVFLVPRPLDNARLPYPPGIPTPTYSTMIDWWKKFRATGDNARETPYNHIVPRLTTQSNVFQVHYRVQLLKNPRQQPPAEWDEEMGAVLGEYRGATLLERYIDPNDPDIPDFASGPMNGANQSLSQYYRFRVIRKKQFAP